MGSPRNLVDSPVPNCGFGACRPRPSDTATTICMRLEGEPDEDRHSPSQ